MTKITFSPDSLSGRGIELLINDLDAVLIYEGILTTCTEKIKGINQLEQVKGDPSTLRVYSIDHEKFLKAYLNSWSNSDDATIN